MRKSRLRKSKVLVSERDQVWSRSTTLSGTVTLCPFRLGSKPFRRGPVTSKYSRMFRPCDGPGPDAASLKDLGSAMATEEALTRARDDSRMPAGYTYLAHLLAHDLTFDKTQGMPGATMQVELLENARTPFVDLESVYGRGPAGGDEALYESDGVRLKLGAVKGARGVKWNDLPRRSDGSAIIVDERNDENLTTAQTLVAFLQFHNKVAGFFDPGSSGAKAMFAEVRACVVQHLQSIVLHDLLWRLVPDGTYHDVMSNGRKIFCPNGLREGERPALPIEFALAAFRLGHSMVRSSYRWNDAKQNVPLYRLFELTGRNSSTGFEALAEEWIIDWHNFYDFSMIEGAQRRKEINFSRKIDTRITSHLGRLPAGERAHGEPPNLAARDLLRGRCFNLPSGQQAARQCYRDYGVYVGCLTVDEICAVAEQATRDVLVKHSLHERTPLWFYILAESEVEQNGERLGRLGGRIVMEVLHGLIEFTPNSILRDARWRPTLPAIRNDMYSMPDLLHFVAERAPHAADA